MAMDFEITAVSIRTRCVAPSPGETDAKGRPVVQKMYWDSRLTGFGVVCGRTTKTFIVQRSVDGKTIRRKLESYPRMTVPAARDAAQELLVKLGKGIDPKVERREIAAKHVQTEWQRLTLREGLANHIADMRQRGCAPRTPLQMENEMGRLLADWLDRPLAGIRRKDCIERHRKITADNGPVIANRMMRCLRAVWNSARRTYEDFPAHPVVGVVLNKQRRRREPIPWAELPAWWEKVRGLPNAIRRDLNLLMLFTGLRATDACTVRWSDVKFKDGALHRPSPKGGTDRAFTVPLPRYILRLLARRRVGNRMYFPEGDGGFVFPTKNDSGKIVAIVEPKEQRFSPLSNGKVKKKLYLPSPHRLRDSFATACLEAGVGHTETKILMNHSLPNADVTQGYQRPSADHLRGNVDRVAAFLLGKKKRPVAQKKAKGRKAK